MNLLAGHRHASVRHYAAELLAGGRVHHEGNPLHDFSLQVSVVRAYCRSHSSLYFVSLLQSKQAFLDRFVYKNPKKKRRDEPIPRSGGVLPLRAGKRPGPKNVVNVPTFLKWHNVYYFFCFLCYLFICLFSFFLKKNKMFFSTHLPINFT